MKSLHFKSTSRFSDQAELRNVLTEPQLRQSQFCKKKLNVLKTLKYFLLQILQYLLT